VKEVRSLPSARSASLSSSYIYPTSPSAYTQRAGQETGREQGRPIVIYPLKARPPSYVPMTGERGESENQGACVVQ